MTDRTPLSPAAQAVLDAVTAELDWDARYHSHEAAAAALRAAALYSYCPVDRRILAAIADELENQ